MKSGSIYDRPFALLDIQRAAAARLAGPSCAEMVAAADLTLATRLERRNRELDNLAERIAIDGEGKDIRDEILPPLTGQQEFLPKLLNGSQAKTAFALRCNAERMIKEGGLCATGFLTLTVGGYDADGKFQQVRDAAEASRRINNLNRRVLPDLFERAIIVTERHKSEAIHFHILGTLRGRPDIRTGLNFEAIEKRDYRSAPEPLREIWAMLRRVLTQYGFGRAELLPVKKTGEAVACYVSKYIEKNVCNRLKDDKRKKLVRYLGWDKKQLKPNEFSWAGKKAIAWRWKARTLAGLIGVETREQAAEALGPRWAYELTRLWRQTLGDDLKHGFDWSWRDREFFRAELAGRNLRWANRRENERYQFTAEFREMQEMQPGKSPHNSDNQQN